MLMFFIGMIVGSTVSFAVYAVVSVCKEDCSKVNCSRKGVSNDREMDP